MSFLTARLYCTYMLPDVILAIRGGDKNLKQYWRKQHGVLGDM